MLSAKWGLVSASTWAAQRVLEMPLSFASDMVEAEDVSRRAAQSERRKRYDMTAFSLFSVYKSRPSRNKFVWHRSEVNFRVCRTTLRPLSTQRPSRVPARLPPLKLFPSKPHSPISSPAKLFFGLPCSRPPPSVPPFSKHGPRLHVSLNIASWTRTPRPSLVVTARPFPSYCGSWAHPSYIHTSTFVCCC